jgi:hypothetical protein
VEVCVEIWLTAISGLRSGHVASHFRVQSLRARPCFSDFRGVNVTFSTSSHLFLAVLVGLYRVACRSRCSNSCVAANFARKGFAARPIQIPCEFLPFHGRCRERGRVSLHSLTSLPLPIAVSVGIFVFRPHSLPKRGLAAYRHHSCDCVCDDIAPPFPRDPLLCLAFHSTGLH